MTRIAFISQVYKPSHDATSQLLAGLAEQLSSTGLDVHVVTSAANYMTGERMPLFEIINGVSIWRTPCLPVSKFTFSGRVLLYASFLGLSWPWLFRIPRPDIVFYLSTPPLLGVSAGLMAKVRDAKTCFVAHDIHPDVLVRLGKLRNRVLIAALAGLDRMILRQFDHAVVLGESMRNTLREKGVAADKVSVIENWCVNDEIVPVNSLQNSMRVDLGLTKNFVVQYSGNMGAAHEMEIIVDAATILRDDENIVFMLIGDGTKRATVEHEKERRALDNLLLYSYQPREKLAVTLTAADVGLVSLAPCMEGLVLPSKLYGILAAGVPVLFVGDENGEVASILREARCGVAVSTAQKLADAVVRLRDNRRERLEMGRRARRLSDQAYGREMAVEKYLKLIERLLTNRR
jgi:putative colanic acid biosynthesis glycosyltransferase WcaI